MIDYSYGQIVWIKIVWKKTYRAEACKTFVEKICFDWIDTFDYDVQSDVEFFALNQQWVFHISLHQVLVMICIARQIVELLYQ